MLIEKSTNTFHKVQKIHKNIYKNAYFTLFKIKNENLISRLNKLINSIGM